MRVWYKDTRGVFKCHERNSWCESVFKNTAETWNDNDPNEDQLVWGLNSSSSGEMMFFLWIKLIFRTPLADRQWTTCIVQLLVMCLIIRILTCDSSVGLQRRLPANENGSWTSLSANHSQVLRGGAWRWPMERESLCLLMMSSYLSPALIKQHN